MAILINSGGISWDGKFVNWNQFVHFQGRHRVHCPNTGAIETQGSLIIPAIARAVPQSFIQAVCTWGGYSGIAGRINNKNTPAHIAACFQAALGFLSTSQSIPSYIRAMQSVNAIKELGTPSFASKHLRMLLPDKCGVLDKKVHESTGYSFDGYGFAEYSLVCVQIAQKMEQERLINPALNNPLRLSGEWLAADIDAVVFAVISGW
jgi:hypothetical protein